MTTHRAIILLLCIVVVAITLLGCDELDGTGDARNEWQGEVNSRQRVDPPPASPTPEESAE